MSRPAGTFRSLYEQLCELPPRMVGEILGGVLRAHPRPAARHGVAVTTLGGQLVLPWQIGRGGPGGWWILIEPELHLRRDEVVLVPDLAGWRKARMPNLPDDHRFEIVPEWVCEILSPSTERFDRQEKMDAYADYGVRCCWLVDPRSRVLEVHTLEEGRWQPGETFRDDDSVAAPPFEAVTIELATLWGDPVRDVAG